MKVTFLKDTGPILQTQWELYREGVKADLPGGEWLIAKGYAREGWEKPVPPPVKASKDLVSELKAALAFRAEPKEPKKPKEPPPLLKVDLEDMTVKELKEMAKNREITGYSGMKKAELVKELADD